MGSCPSLVGWQKHHAVGRVLRCGRHPTQPSSYCCSRACVRWRTSPARQHPSPPVKPRNISDMSLLETAKGSARCVSACACMPAVRCMRALHVCLHACIAHAGVMLCVCSARASCAQCACACVVRAPVCVHFACVFSVCVQCACLHVVCLRAVRLLCVQCTCIVHACIVCVCVRVRACVRVVLTPCWHLLEDKDGQGGTLPL